MFIFEYKFYIKFLFVISLIKTVSNMIFNEQTHYCSESLEKNMFYRRIERKTVLIAPAAVVILYQQCLILTSQFSSVCVCVSWLIRFLVFAGATPRIKNAHIKVGKQKQFVLWRKLSGERFSESSYPRRHSGRGYSTRQSVVSRSLAFGTTSYPGGRESTGR